MYTFGMSILAHDQRRGYDAARIRGRPGFHNITTRNMNGNFGRRRSSCQIEREFSNRQESEMIDRREVYLTAF